MDDSGWTDNSGWALAIIVVGMLLFELGRRWYRQRIAGKLADTLLSDVLKGKDVFRR